MLFLYFLMLVLAVDGHSEQITSALEEIITVLSAVNLRLDRIEDQQKITESIYSSQQEEKLNCVQKEQSENFLWQRYIVWLVNEQQTNDEDLETRQNTMMSQINQLVSNTDRCCRDNIRATCVGFTSAPLPARQPLADINFAPLPPRQPPAAAPAALRDCKTLSDGVHQLQVGNEQISVYCADGFVTFQRRYNGELNFDRTYSEYEQGFGATSSEHWLGLRYLHEMTKDKSCTFRARIAVDNTQHNKKLCEPKYTADCDGEIKEIVARDFRVSSAAEKYELQIFLNQTDFLNPIIQGSITGINGRKFTTKDQDNDEHRTSNCADLGHVIDGGFWYQHCYPGYPNAVVSSDKTVCSNSVCGNWWPYYFTSSLLQFSC